MTERRGRGRPKKSERGVRLVRLPTEIVEMIGWVTRVEGISAANFLLPLIQEEVVARYDKWRPEIERLKHTEAEVAEAARKRHLAENPPLVTDEEWDEWGRKTPEQQAEDNARGFAAMDHHAKPTPSGQLPSRLKPKTAKKGKTKPQK